MRNDTKMSLERVFHRLSKHPFLSVTVMCLLLFFFGFCYKRYLTGWSYVYAGAVMAAIYALLLIFGRICRSVSEAAVVFLAAAVLTAGGLFLMRSYENSVAVLLWLSLMLLAAMCLLMRAAGVLTHRNFIVLMVMTGIMLRLCYCLYTGWGDRQYDVGYFNWTYGHANYIEHWYNNGLRLPDSEEIMTWQYYHPPLHHWLMALLLRMLTVCGMEYEKACEALQFLPFLYSALLIPVCYRIFRYVHLAKTPLVIAMTIVCFHPAFLHMSGSFNNDMLCVLMMMLSVMFALRWYAQPTLKRIIPTALCVGLGMMTKLSAWMVAPAIAVMFLYVFIKNIRAWKKYLGQFAVFGALSVPLGLWWPLRNLIAFDMPLTYVPYGNPQADQFCGDMSAAERLFDFGNGQLSYVYVAYTDPGFDAAYCDYNPTVGLFKTAIFGEGQNGISEIHFPRIALTGPILFWIGVVLGLLCFIAFLSMMLRGDLGVDGLSRVFFSLLVLTMLGSYYAFCFKFPFTCTMNIRYCLPLIPLFAMGLGLLLRLCSGSGIFDRILRYSVCVLTAAFAVMTCLVYAQVSLPTI